MEFFLEIAVVVIFILAFGLFFFKWRLDAARFQLAQSEREQLHTRDELTRLRTQWQAVTENVGGSVILVDTQARVLFMNDAAKSVFQLGDAFGRDFNVIAQTWDFLPMVQEVLAQKTDSLAQTIAKDERVFQVRVRALASEFQRGAIIILNEVTELQRLGRIRRDFVANISHELRTPVTTLGLLAETLASDLPSDALLAREHLEKLRGQVDVLSQLSNEMMDLALIESGRMPLELVDTSVVDLVKQVLDGWRMQAERQELQLVVEVPDDLRVWADANGMRKVLGNLIHNAIKFTPAHGTITIRARRDNDNAEFQIADTGIGIPAKDLPRIFERFYKVDQARTAGETRGTGLGLAIAKHVIEGHGGKIWVTSKEGRGTTFYFTLPGTV